MIDPKMCLLFSLYLILDQLSPSAPIILADTEIKIIVRSRSEINKLKFSMDKNTIPRKMIIQTKKNWEYLDIWLGSHL